MKEDLVGYRGVEGMGSAGAEVSAVGVTEQEASDMLDDFMADKEHVERQVNKIEFINNQLLELIAKTRKAGKETAVISFGEMAALTSFQLNGGESDLANALTSKMTINVAVPELEKLLSKNLAFLGRLKREEKSN